MTDRQSTTNAFYWQDWVTTALGLWLIVSPIVVPFLFAGSAGAPLLVDVNFFVVGLVIVFVAWSAIVTLQDWEEWVDALLGLWLVVSPWVLGFGNLTALMWDATIVGVLIILFAIWARYSRPSLMNRR